MTRYLPAAEVGVIDQDGVVYVARLPEGPIVVLEGTAGVIWRAACEDGEGPVAERAAVFVDASAEEIAAPVEEFLADLVSRGLLVQG